MANIANIKPDTKTFEIKHPGTGEVMGVRVTLMSTDDERYQGMRRAIQNLVMKADASGRPMKADVLEAQKDQAIFAAMIGWEWHEDANGEKTDFNGEIPEFNRKKVFEVFHAIPWFRDQINEELGNDASFY